ncbi:hypothetical protein M404DRAFT_994474 [Pisolithus tinctorius Marx 270]|uniref:Uncharacterized protein n=1 Tax=Pisolithus tinctorius Marx 270 TaxID=870435 RepID=A0A0C3KQC9_PISTI|nr:hypothetical protein M404DRAFT_994474 [Pisolithus tinctorius Marx 270]
MCSVEPDIEDVVSVVVAARSQPSRVNFRFAIHSTDQTPMSSLPYPLAKMHCCFGKTAEWAQRHF